MTEPIDVMVTERLKRDLYVVFGSQIPIYTLGVMLGFNSCETLQKALKRKLKLTIHCGPPGGKPYVNTDDLLQLLKAEYEKVVRQEDNQDFKGV